MNIANFLVHHERRGRSGTEVDLLAARFPFRKELALSQTPMDDHPVFNSSGKIDVIICEVKTGLCDLNGPWTDPSAMNLDRVLYAVGAFPEREVPDVSRALYEDRTYEDSTFRVRLFTVGKWRNSRLADAVVQLTWEEVLAFIYERFKKYRNEKAQHAQWDSTGRRLFGKTGKHRKANTFVQDVLREMGL